MTAFLCKIDSKFTCVLLIIFSILLALGTWNPFLPAADIENENSGFSLAQIYSVIFIAYLFFIRFFNYGQLKFAGWKKYIVLFYITLLLSTFYWSINELSISTAVFFLKFFLSVSLCFLLPEIFVRNKRYLYYSLAAFSFACGFVALLFSIGALDEFTYISKGRVFIFGENPNSTSGRITIAFLLLLYLIFKNPLKWKRRRFWFCLLFFPMLMMIIASGSRGSFIILCIGIIAFLLLNPSVNNIKKYLILICSVIAIGIAISFIVSRHSEFSLFSRLENSLEYGETAGRERLNSYSLQIFEENPLVGKGTIGYTKEMSLKFNEHRTVHNLYIYILATSGIVGFILFMFFMAILLFKSIQIRRYDYLPLIVFGFIFLLAYKTGGVLTYLLMWYLFSVIISLIDLELYERQNYNIVDGVESDKVGQ